MNLGQKDWNLSKWVDLIWEKGTWVGDRLGVVGVGWVGWEIGDDGDLLLLLLGFFGS